MSREQGSELGRGTRAAWIGCTRCRHGRGSSPQPQPPSGALIRWSARVLPAQDHEAIQFRVSVSEVAARGCRQGCPGSSARPCAANAQRRRAAHAQRRRARLDKELQRFPPRLAEPQVRVWCMLDCGSASHTRRRAHCGRPVAASETGRGPCPRRRHRGASRPSLDAATRLACRAIHLPCPRALVRDPLRTAAVRLERGYGLAARAASGPSGRSARARMGRSRESSAGPMRSAAQPCRPGKPARHSRG